GVYIDEFAPDGKIRPDYLGLHIDGRVYRIDPATGKTQKLDSGIRFTNGIAFGPDKSLFVDETVTGAVFRYEWRDGGIDGPRLAFGNTNDSAGPPGWRGPDGMAFGNDGLLYAAVFGQRDVTVLGADGAVVSRIATKGILPTNVAFGPPGQKKIYV